jgi:hypothetical protein
MYAELFAALKEKLKLPRHIGKKGSRFKVEFTPRMLNVLSKLKGGSVVIPDKPSVLREYASR